MKTIILTLAVLVSSSFASTLSGGNLIPLTGSSTPIRLVQPISTGTIVQAAPIPVRHYFVPAVTTHVIRAAPVIRYAIPTFTRVVPVTTYIRPIGVSGGLLGHGFGNSLIGLSGDYLKKK